MAASDDMTGVFFDILNTLSQSDVFSGQYSFPLPSEKNQRFSDVFRELREEHWPDVGWW